MPSGKNQKLKLSFLSQIMLSKTDEEHHLTLPEIQQLLEEKDVTADRKALYRDLKALNYFGIEVISQRTGNKCEYYVANKTFDLAELKLLVDSIQCSKFITEKKSNNLIEKIGNLASEYEAEQLKRQVIVQGRVKTMNESIYYNVDRIYHAIDANKQITFEYMRWNQNKKLEKRQEELYQVSPWALTWAEENYYLIAFDEMKNGIHHYRVDKMKNIKLADEDRIGRKEFEEFNVVDYVRMSFGMFGGDKSKVYIECRNDMIGTIFDRFGTNIPVKPSKKEGWSETEVEVMLTDHFLAWIFALGNGVKITGPGEVMDRVDTMIERLVETYKE